MNNQNYSTNTPLKSTGTHQERFNVFFDAFYQLTQNQQGAFKAWFIGVYVPSFTICLSSPANYEGVAQ